MGGHSPGFAPQLSPDDLDPISSLFCLFSPTLLSHGRPQTTNEERLYLRRTIGIDPRSCSRSNVVTAKRERERERRKSFMTPINSSDDDLCNSDILGPLIAK